MVPRAQKHRRLKRMAERSDDGVASPKQTKKSRLVKLTAVESESVHSAPQEPSVPSAHSEPEPASEDSYKEKKPKPKPKAKKQRKDGSKAKKAVVQTESANLVKAQNKLIGTIANTDIFQDDLQDPSVDSVKPDEQL